MSNADASFSKLSLLSRLSGRSSFIGPTKFKIAVQLLDDNENIFLELKKGATGQDILDHVCACLNIVEKDYFGIRYQDVYKHRYWLDLSKPLAKIFRSESLALRFRFRFYPESPFSLREEITRYQLFVQLQRDLLHGRLHCPQNEATSLAGLVLQSVLGDYNPEEHAPGYVSAYRLLLKQTPRHEEKIEEMHKNSKEMTPADAENKFFEIASKLETYGFDPFVIKDSKSQQDVILGATCRGFLLFLKTQRIQSISWLNIEKIDYFGKQLRITPSKAYVTEYLQKRAETSFGSSILSESTLDDKSDTSKKHHIKFLCPSVTFAKHLWRHLLSQQVFYTEDVAKLVKPKFSKPRIPLFTRGSTFRCPTRRVQHEIAQESSPPRPDQPSAFVRYALPKQTPRTAQPWIKQNGTMPHEVEKKDDITQTSTAPIVLNTTGDSNAVSVIVTENVTEISILLTKTEPIDNEEAVQYSSSTDVSMPFGDVAADSKEPRTSTPNPSEEELSDALPTTTPLFTPSPAEPTVANGKIAHKNGKIANGNVHTYSSSLCKKLNRAEPVMWTVVHWTLTLFLIFLLCVAIFVAVFEAAETSGDPRWIYSFPQLETFHSRVYSPWRHSLLHAYHNFFRH
jgi:hypothetical protein